MTNRRRAGFETMSASFLDIIACALGGTLLLLLLVKESSQEEVRQSRQDKQQMQSRIDAAGQALKNATAETEKLKHEQQADSDRLAELEDALAKAQAALVGLEGKMRNVVFIFDTSGSMEYNEFKTYRDHLSKLVRDYPFEKFNIVRFGGTVEVWRPNDLAVATTPNRNVAVREFIGKFTPDGGTPTLKAIKAAYALPGVDTILIYTDGMPSGDKEEQNAVIDYAASKKSVVVNTIAIGPGRHHKFMHELAEVTGGTYQNL